jgi:NDP-sugar pyrophosphorylase family protein
MKAMLFAAGLGTRLHPLTLGKPKALVEVNGLPLLEIALRRLINAGCKEVVINVHHFAEQITRFIKRKKSFGIRIAISDERGQLLETGGGLKKAAWFFDDGQPLFLCNTDVLTDLDLSAFYEAHLQSGAAATLAVRRRKTSRYLLFDKNMRMQGWRNSGTGETRWCSQPAPAKVSEWGFSGLHVVDPALFDWMPAEEKFSIIEVYLKAAAVVRIAGYPHDDDFWLDVGKPEALEKAAQRIAGLDLGIR